MNQKQNSACTIKMIIKWLKWQSIMEWSEDWVNLNWQQNFNNRSSKVQIIESSRNRVGKNRLINRLTITNNKIEFAWLYQSYESYKIKCKEIFLNWGWQQQKNVYLIDKIITLTLKSKSKHCAERTCSNFFFFFFFF